VLLLTAFKSGVTGPSVTKIEKFILFDHLKSELQYCNPLWNGNATKNEAFSTLVGCHATYLKGSMIHQVNKPFYPSTVPEILVKIGLSAFGKQVLESRPLKMLKKIKKDINKYIAISASVPSGLSKSLFLDSSISVSALELAINY